MTQHCFKLTFDHCGPGTCELLPSQKHRGNSKPKDGFLLNNLYIAYVFGNDNQVCPQNVMPISGKGLYACLTNTNFPHLVLLV